MVLILSAGQAIASAGFILGDVDAVVIEDGDWWVLGWACERGSEEPVVLTVRSARPNAPILGQISTGERSEPAVAAVCRNRSMMQRFRFRIQPDRVSDAVGWPLEVTAGGRHLANSGFHVLPAAAGHDPLSQMLSHVRTEGNLSVLFVQAHADDEQHAMPIIAQLCPRAEVRCEFAVATGKGSAREQELRALAAHIGGDVRVIMGLPPGNDARSPRQVQADWSRYLGGVDLVQWMADLLNQVAADVIVALDPRHGVTCHPEHRAIGEILLQAVARLNYPPERVLLAAHVLRIEDGQRWLGPPVNSFIQPKVAIGPLPEASTSGYWLYSGDARAYWPAPGGERVWDWQLGLTQHYQSQWAGTPYLEWLRPLHLRDGQWVGNDSSGRITVFQHLSDFHPQQPLAAS